MSCFWRTTIKTFVPLLINSACTPLLAFFMGETVDSVNTLDEAPKNLSVLAAISVAYAGSLVLYNYLLTYVVEREVQHIRLKLFDHFVAQTMNANASTLIGNVINKLVADVGILQTTLQQTLPEVVRNSLQCALFLILTFYINWSYGLLLLGMYFLLAGSTVGQMFATAKQIAEKQASRSQYSQFIGEAVGSLKLIYLYDKREYFHSVFKQLLKKSTKLEMKTVKSTSLFLFVTNVTSFATIVAAATMLYYSDQRVSLGDILTLWTVIINSSVFARLLAARAAEFGRNLVVIQTLINLPTAAENIHEEAGDENAPVDNHISIENLTFTRGSNSIFQGLSIEFPANGLYAVVGLSGSGKSTLMEILLGNYSGLYTGAVNVGKRSIEQCGSSWRKMLGYVPQEINLFSGTIEDNIRFGNDFCTMDSVLSAAQVADCHDFIVSLSEGYKTIIGSGGVNLSGGQKQRIGLARALLRNPKVLILDEATSALDVETEKKITTNLRQLNRSMTIIMVIHRLYLAQDTDGIVVLSNGRIVQKGHFSDLSKNEGLFSRLLLLQEMEHNESNNIRTRSSTL